MKKIDTIGQIVQNGQIKNMDKLDNIEKLDNMDKNWRVWKMVIKMKISTKKHDAMYSRFKKPRNLSEIMVLKHLESSFVECGSCGVDSMFVFPPTCSFANGMEKTR